MPGPLVTFTSMLAQVSDGVNAWSQFVRSADRALSSNQALAPLLGLAILLLLVVLADWKLASWLERHWRQRLWRQRHKDHDHRGKPNGRAATARRRHARY